MQVFILNHYSNNKLYKVFDSIEAIKEHFEGKNYNIEVYGNSEISIEIDDQYGISQFNGYNTEMIEKLYIPSVCEECGLRFCECYQEEED